MNREPITEANLLKQVKAAIKAKYGTQAVCALRHQVADPVISKILHGTQVMPAWLLKDLGIRVTVTTTYEWVNP